MTDEAQTDSEGHQIVRRVFAHMQRHWRTLSIAASLWFVAAIVANAFMPDRAVTGRWPVVLGLTVLVFWTSIPVVVFAHRMVLFGPEKARPGIPWRWGATEWRFFGNGLLVFLIMVGIALLCVIPIGIIVRVALGAQAAAAPAVSLLAMPLLFAVLGLSMLSAPIVVVGQTKPIGTSWKLIWGRKWLAFNLLFVYVVASLVMSGINWLTNRLGVPWVAWLINGPLAVALGIAAATGLSFLYLHVRDDIPQSTEASPAVA